jgi:alpha-amylase
MQFEEGLEGEIELATHVEDWRDEVIYQLLVDRFANGDAGNDHRVDLSAMGKYHGGDWRGVEEQLPYLDALGVTTLWISPVVKNVDEDAGFDGYHGYWAQDLTAPNPHFGDLAALRRLVNAAHERGMKVIVDIVTNHLGQLFYYDINMNGQPDDRVFGDGTGGKSPVGHVNEYDPDFDPRGIQAYTSLGESGPAPVVFVYDPATNHVPPEPALFQRPEAFNRKGRTYNFDDPDQLLHGDFPGGLKDVDTSRCDVKQTMVDVYARWVELTDIDGFRIDTVKHVEREFWRYFTQKLRQRLAAKGKQNFFLFGESFDGNDELCGKYTKNDAPLEEEQACVLDGVPLTGDQLDSVFYFPQHFQAIRDVFVDAKATKPIETLWSSRTTTWGTTPAEGGVGLAPSDIPVNFLDNHDVPRFLWPGRGHVGDPQKGLELALLFQFTEQGIPCVYYGTEQGFAGGNDPGNREDLWSTNYATDGRFFQFMARLARIREAYPAIRRGQQSVVWATEHAGAEEDANIFAYERSGGDAGDGYVLVVINASPSNDSRTSFEGANMAVSVAPGTTLVDVLAGGSATVGGDGTTVIALPPQSAVILVPQGQLVAGL